MNRDNILNQIEKLHDVSLPGNLVQQELALITQGLKKEDSEKNKKESEKIAKKRIKLGLILNELGEKNNLKVDEQEFEQVQIELDAFLQQQADPYWASEVAMNNMIYGDEEYYRIFPSPSQIESFTPQKALAIYEDRFNGADGLVVVITGDIPIRDDVEELSETYIATLPLGISEQLGEQPLLPSGILTEYVSSGENQASSGFDIGFQNFDRCTTPLKRAYYVTLIMTRD